MFDQPLPSTSTSVANVFMEEPIAESVVARKLELEILKGRTEFA